MKRYPGDHVCVILRGKIYHRLSCLVMSSVLGQSRYGKSTQSVVSEARGIKKSLTALLLFYIVSSARYHFLKRLKPKRHGI